MAHELLLKYSAKSSNGSLFSSLVSDAELVRVDPQLAQGLAQLLDVELDHLDEVIPADERGGRGEEDDGEVARDAAVGDVLGVDQRHAPRRLVRVDVAHRLRRLPPRQRNLRRRRQDKR